MSNKKKTICRSPGKIRKIMHQLLIILAFFSITSAANASQDPFDVENAVEKQPAGAVCSSDLSGKKLRLADVINLALCQNPQTKQLYMNALSIASEYGQAKSAYLPNLDLTAGITQTDTRVRRGNDTDSSLASAGLSLDWLLYDFGGREASTEMVRQSLNAALATRSDTLQNLIFDTTEAYYLLFAAEEEYKNSQATLEAAFSAYEAAAKRYELGLAALSDKLQAETSYSEAQLTVTKAEESLELSRGNLAILLNFPPDKRLELYEEQHTVDSLTIPENVTELFQTALEKRSDVLAKKAEIKQYESNIDYQKAQNAPSFAVSAGVKANDELSGGSRSYSGNVGLTMTVPLFTGFKNQYKISQSHYQLEKAKAELGQLENSIQTEVWTTFQNFYTAKKSYEISLTMFSSADQNAKVALGAYRAGKGSILTVLDAQSKLADVRTTRSRSFYALLIAKSNIIRKIGLIDPFKNEQRIVTR